MFRLAYANQNSAMNASAAAAEAASCCASQASCNCMMITMGAAIMASILICTLRLAGFTLPVLVWAISILLTIAISILLLKELPHAEQER